MRLLMYRDLNGVHLGVLRDDEVIDLHALSHSARVDPLPTSMLDLIALGDDGLKRVQSLLDRAEVGSLHASCITALRDVEVMAPLNPPCGNVLCIGRNYLAHAEESARATGGKVTRPTVFTKAQTSIIGPYSDVTIDTNVSTEIDWEVELGVIIGKSGKNISREQALDHVFGYTIVNDVSARDIQMNWGGQYFKGKSLDGSCPIGPWVVTRDEIPDPQNVGIRLRVNGETKQDASTAHMIFRVDELIAQLSIGMTLPAGTLIATGTPEGVGFARTPPEFLRPGDSMESEIDGIGIMRNRIVQA